MTAETKKDQIDALRRDGFVIVRGLMSASDCSHARERAMGQLRAADPPLELEADLRYPGAPASSSAPGGQTVRRLLDAYGRDPAFAAFATSADVSGWMTTCFGEQALLSRVHHNCVMTKHPQYGSLTGWHRDARYWSFERDDLVSAWFALGDETASNGGLWLIPGSHRPDFASEAFDAAKFFRDDLPGNQEMIRGAVSPTLAAGDVIFFHCNTLHAAGKNLSERIKFSLVFTYHGVSNAPRPGTRSASRPEVPV